MPIALPEDDDVSTAESAVRGPGPEWFRAPRYGSYRPGPRDYRTMIGDYFHNAKRKFEALSQLQKLLAVIGLICGIVFLVVIVILNKKIIALNKSVLSWLVATAKKRRENWWGWLIPWLGITLLSFPPLIGHGSFVTLAGLMYGVPKGFLIAVTSNTAGALGVFFVCNSFMKGYMSRRIAKDKRFAAFSLVLKHDGLKLLCMIRLCPLPYSFSNGAMATFPTVNWINFTLAPVVVSPMLLFPLFIGSRLGKLAEAEDMKSWVKGVNYFSILFSFAIGATTGILVYRQTKARAAELEAEERETTQDPDSLSLSEYTDDFDDAEEVGTVDPDRL